MTEPPRILVVEDDRSLAGMLAELLKSEGYQVTLAFDGQRALHEGLTHSFDVLLLDRGLPGVEGLDVLTRLRSRGVLTPALVLSALGNPADRVEGLDRGAEDYLAKPFDVDELLARLRALRRRSAALTPVLPVPGGVLDTTGRTVTTDTGEVVVLSDREGALLEHLARRPGQVFPRVDLLDAVFPDADDDGVVDTYVHYLRRKLGKGIVLTVRGIGYRLGART
ncbi:response regulator transcription factor [Arthrobacter sp. zg-Y820]|uniref:response regulator transcription factor n=1 Tax=unclassified Arthrobacter TaxID=235627 RepID=UPI001E50C23C|nr:MULTISPECIES: response regulator transcription factor [unclassified Arthrobacter]MCC9196886.1 response regulator transcription factor [Arthrobacter sp. zg-Y820]MDK1279750.1 response regulator transcription factor [Arthrobacter sp. zg.Y820]MDK1358656.1 response regulator transcription factor [Arthrobacter sp. zg-Y1219]WIB10994.1 response regulator transcription factor [Arthrobacter sp. zg-Y820]